MSPRICTALCVAVLGIVAAPAGAAAPQAPAAATPRMPAALPDEIILEFKDGCAPRARTEILAAIGALETTPLGRTGALRVRLAGSAMQAVARFGVHPQLRYIEPNYRVTATAVPGDPLFAQQWALQNTGQTGGTPGADIRATEAWDVSTGSAAVLIGVIDSGIDLAHPDLAANVFTNPGEIPDNAVDDDANGFVDDVHGWNFVGDNNDVRDDHGHGTWMSGVAGAVGDNGVGIAGVCWTVRLLPIKFLDANGSGTTADAVLALDYAVRVGARVTNNSWGGGGFSQALFDAITAADEAGVLFVTGAGAQSTNIDVQPVYPASYDVPNVIAVTATDHNDVLYSASSWGPNTVDLAAPGVNIVTTGLGASYRVLSGTSTATAHVVGALGLVFAHYPDIPGGQAASHLLTHVELVPSLEGLVRTNGRLDVYSPLVSVLTDIAANARDASAALRLWVGRTTREGTWLEMDLPRGQASLQIFDVRGRLVRRLFAAPGALGHHTVLWDGRDDGGGRVGRGLYLARLTDGASAAVARLPMLR